MWPLAALSIAEKAGDLVYQARCLTYLTILYRQKDQVEKALVYAIKSFNVAESVEMIEYQGTAKANQGWAAWRKEVWAEAKDHCLAALDLWEQVADHHASCVFQWTARWPLVALALAQDQLEAALQQAQFMLNPPQQRLPAQLTAMLEDAAAAWAQAQPARVKNVLEKAVDVAQALHYL
jgi:hypothetical protein